MFFQSSKMSNFYLQPQLSHSMNLPPPTFNFGRLLPPPVQLSNLPHFNDENTQGVNFVPYSQLATQIVEDRGSCVVVEIRTIPHKELQTYYSEDQKDNIVIGRALLKDGSRRKVQRIMIGQVWIDFIRNTGLGGHAIGKLLAYITNEPVTIYGMFVSIGTAGSLVSKASPSMIGLWISIDTQDHADSLLDLQRATILFAKNGILCAFTVEEHQRLLQIGNSRRSRGNTGLPESPMTFEAAKNPPKRIDGEKELDVYRYYPPRNHEHPQTRGGYKPFVVRWNERVVSVPEEKKNFAFLNLDMDTLEPWMRRIVYRMKPIQRRAEDDEIVVEIMEKQVTWC